MPPSAAAACREGRPRAGSLIAAKQTKVRTEMTLNAEKTVGEIAAEYPAAARVFEKHHIDYCCGGKHAVAETCRVAGVRAEDVMAEVGRASWTPLSQPVPDLNIAP